MDLDVACWRRPLTLLVLLAGAYTSVSFFADSWEGARCWIFGGNYDVPFDVALSGAIEALKARIQSSPTVAALEILCHTAFIWPVAAILISNRPIILAIGLVLTLMPFALLVHQPTDFCDGGMNAFGLAAMQLFIALPLGILAFVAAAIRPD